jgi:hypothetical protein
VLFRSDEIEDGECLVMDNDTETPPTQNNEEETELDAKASDKSTTSAAADIPTEARMDPKLMAALAALSAQHPTHAAALVAKANASGATAEDLHSIIAKAKDEDLVKANAMIADLKAQAKALEDAKVKAESDLAALKAHGTAHQDPGADSSNKQNIKTISLAEFNKNQGEHADAIRKGTTVVAG